MTTKTNPSEPSPEEQLVAFYNRNGYTRIPDIERRKNESRHYKKGYEVRLVAKSGRELATMRRLMRAAGIIPSKPFQERDKWRQPIYGYDAVIQFQEWIGQYS